MPLTYEITFDLIKDRFYRCKFTDVLDLIEKIREDRGGELTSEMVLLKANALFELHRIEDAKTALKTVAARSDCYDPEYQYALARFCYLDNDNEGAEAIVRELVEKADTPALRFRALLGLANTHYAKAEFLKIPPLIEQLTQFEPLDKADDRICLLVFLGNYYLHSGVSPDLAKTYFKKALASASEKTWTYLITRALYGIAGVCEKTGDRAELMWTLDILQSFVDESEQVNFSGIVNERFKNYFTINTPVEFDTANQRVFIKSKWIGFHDKPMLFNFLLLLHNANSFISKNQIAEALWPEEDYKPRTHDPRIFDIAKRARQLIEAYESQPVVLLSGRMGYKLASI